MTAAPAPEFQAVHHVILNCLTYLVLVWGEDATAKVHLAELANALQGAPVTSLRTEKLIRAGRAFVKARASTLPEAMERCTADFEARRVLADVFQWRAAGAIAALRPPLAEESGT